MLSSPAANFLNFLVYIVTSYSTSTILLTNATIFLLDKTSTDKRKELLWAAIIADKLQTLYFYLVNSTFLTRLTLTDSLFSRYIEDGFMLTNNTDLNLLTTNLISFYPAQIPITFTSNQHSVNYILILQFL